jgi:formyl-CoA transferase
VVLGSVFDYFTSALLAYGVAAALFKRERSGVGQYLSLSLLRSALTIQAGRFVWAESEGREVARDSGAGGLTGIHPTKRGFYISRFIRNISVHSNHFFAALCELVGRPELARDPRCATMRSRVAHAAELVPELRAALAERSALECEEIFGERVPCSAVRPIEDMFDHPQVLAEDPVATLDHPIVGRYRRHDAVAEPLEIDLLVAHHITFVNQAAAATERSWRKPRSRSSIKSCGSSRPMWRRSVGPSASQRVAVRPRTGLVGKIRLS